MIDKIKLIIETGVLTDNQVKIFLSLCTKGTRDYIDSHSNLTVRMYAEVIKQTLLDLKDEEDAFEEVFMENVGDLNLLGRVKTEEERDKKKILGQMARPMHNSRWV